MSLCTRLKNAVGIAVIFLAVPMAAAQPTSYNANTTLSYYNNPYPALPNWGGITGPVDGATGSVINDPSFGTPIMRVTNANTHTVSGQTGRPFTTPSSSEHRPWNTNSTIFYVYDAAGNNTMVYNFNPTTFVATPRTGDFPLTACMLTEFSATNANVAYGISGTKIMSYNFSTETASTVVDIATIVPGTPPINDVGISHINGLLICTCGGTDQENTVCVVYNPATSTWMALNTQTLLITTSSNPTGIACGLPGTGYLHNAEISQGGRYVCLDAAVSSVQYPTNFHVSIWDTEANSNGGNAYEITTEYAGHKVFGYGNTENAAWLNNDTNLAHTNETWLIRAPTPTGVQTYSDLVEHPSTDPQRWDANGLSYDQHMSFNNSTSAASQPVFSDTYHMAADTGDPHCCWGDEIIAIGTSSTAGNNTVWRFAQHRSTQNQYGANKATNFYDTPRGNISQDGLFFMFTSNYGDTLGTYSSNGQYRTDVFVLKLTAGN